MSNSKTLIIFVIIATVAYTVYLNISYTKAKFTLPQFQINGNRTLFQKDMNEEGTLGYMSLVNVVNDAKMPNSRQHNLDDSTSEYIIFSENASQYLVLYERNWTLTFSEKPFRVYAVKDEGSFLDRVQHYNEAIQNLFSKVWSNKKLADWHDISQSIHVVWGSYDDFFMHLANYSHIKTVVLPWKLAYEHNSGKKKWSSLSDHENLLIQKYYTWITTNPLCHWIETKGKTKHRWDGVYNRSCTVDFNRSLPVQSLEMLYLHGKPINKNNYWPNNGDIYPTYFYTDLPPFVFYMHVAENAVITNTGDIFSGNLKIVPYTCTLDINPNPPPSYLGTPVYRDVFTASQYWCQHGFFHKILECLPRIAPYLDFLQRNKDILVHVSETTGTTAEILQYLGIKSERLITGVCRAKVVYMPQGTPCGFPVPTETQLLSFHLRQYFKSKFTERYQNMSKNNLVLIRRSGNRHFTHQELMEKKIQKLAEDYKLTYKLFADNPLPSRETAMEIFNGAQVVVAPHGAGLTNMLFCEPGTLIIEGVCNPPHVNMCYQWTAHILGHRYHGIPSERGCEDVVDVVPENMEFVVRTYLEMLKDKLLQ